MAYVTPRILQQTRKNLSKTCIKYAPKNLEENSHPVKSQPASPPTNPKEEHSSDNGIAKIAAITTGAGVAAGVVVPTAATAALTTAGFTSAGIAAGSVAAGIQSGIGSVAAGSLFASLQSAGALGGFAILGPVGIAAASVAVVGVGTGLLVRKIIKDKAAKEK